MRNFFDDFQDDLIVPIMGTPHRPVPHKHKKGKETEQEHAERWARKHPKRAAKLAKKAAAEEQAAAEQEREGERNEQIATEQQEFIDLTGTQSDIFLGTADDLFAMSQGIDPLFDQAQNDLLGVLGNQRDRGLAQTSNFFNRRGGGNSTASLNALERTGGQFDDRGIELATMLQFAGLDRSDALREESFDLRSSGVNMETIPLQLLIQEMNARNAGNRPEEEDSPSTIDELKEFGDIDYWWKDFDSYNPF